MGATAPPAAVIGMAARLPGEEAGGAVRAARAALAEAGLGEAGLAGRKVGVFAFPASVAREVAVALGLAPALDAAHGSAPASALATLHDAVSALAGGACELAIAVGELGALVLERRAHALAAGHAIRWLLRGAAGHAVVFEDPATGPAFGGELCVEEGQALLTRTFRADERFVADHRVRGTLIVPGAVQIELVLEAAGAWRPGRTVRLAQILFLQPLVVKERCTARAQLTETPDGARFEVTSTGDDGAPVVHSRGAVLFGAGPLPSTVHDLTAIRGRCPDRRDRPEIYRRMRQEGMDFGPTFQGLETLWTGDGEALAELSAPAGDGEALYRAHPTLVDGALQAVLGLVAGRYAEHGMPVLPFFAAGFACSGLAPRCFSHVVQTAATAESSTFDVFVLDASGRVLAELRGFVFRVIASAARPLPPSGRTELYRPVWRPEPLPADDGSTGEPVLVVTRRPDAERELARWPGRVVVAPLSAATDFRALVAGLLDRGEMPRRVVVDATSPAPAGRLEERVQSVVEPVLCLARALLADGRLQDVRLAYVHRSADGLEAALHDTIAGLARCVRRENGQHRYRSVALLEPVASLADVLAIGAGELGAGDHVEVRRRGDERHVSAVAPVEEAPASVEPVQFRDGGVYWITGGLSGLGLIFARHLKERHRAALVLTGRSPLDPARRAALHALSAGGPEAIYLESDVSSRDDVERAFAEIKRRRGRLDGIVHSAGVLADEVVARQSWARFRDAFGPKVLGTVHLDEVTAAEDLSCFVLFSSLAAVIGTHGQSEHVCATRFQDSFAGYRELLRRAGLRHGRTLSIDWPYWEAGGTRLSAQNLDLMTRVAGMEPLTTAGGLATFDRICRLPWTVVTPVHGRQDDIARWLEPVAAPPGG